jgi:hypothetical protein
VIPPDELPVRGEHGGRGVAETAQHTAQAGWDVVGDLRAGRWGEPGETVEVVAFGVGELQGACERRGHLRRRRRVPALLQTDHVIDRDPRQLGEILPAQSGDPASGSGGQSRRARRETFSPRAQHRAEFRGVGGHEIDSRTRREPEGGSGFPTEIRSLATGTAVDDAY